MTEYNPLRNRIAAALKTANDRAAGFIEWYEFADAVIAELHREHAEKADNE